MHRDTPISVCYLLVKSKCIKTFILGCRPINLNELFLIIFLGAEGMCRKSVCGLTTRVLCS